MASAMSSSLYGGLHLYREPGEPTAAELLEASKRLYVKTDILRDMRIEPGTPRIFRSPTEEPTASPPIHVVSRRPRAIVFPIKPVASTTLKPSANSAFRPVVHGKATPPPPPLPAKETLSAPPARPPKSTRIRQRARRIHDGSSPIGSLSPLHSHRGSPPPLHPRLLDFNDNLEEEPRRKTLPCGIDRPVPAPRLSKLSSASANAAHPPPPPIPRRRTIQLDGTHYRYVDMSKSTPELELLSTSPTPRLSSACGHRPTAIACASPSHCHPSTLIRKRIAPTLIRPATPAHAPDGEYSATPKLGETPILSTPSEAAVAHDAVVGKPRLVRRATATLSIPSTSLPLSSPTSKATSKDSGLQPSDEDEDPRKRSAPGSPDYAAAIRMLSSTRLADPKNHHKTVAPSEEVFNEGEEEDSVFTSITNQPRREEVPMTTETPAPALGANFARPLTVIEKHARVMSWIQMSDYTSAEPNGEPQHLSIRPFVGSSLNV